MPSSGITGITNLAAGDKVRAAGRYADSRSPAEGGTQPPSASVLDVWSHSWDSAKSSFRDIVTDPVDAGKSFLGNRVQSLGSVLDGLENGQQRQTLDGAVDSAVAQFEALGDKASKIADAKGALGKVGATFEFLTGIEQLVSAPFSMVPFPAMPALRIGDMDFGMPHAHAHPPNLTPFGLIHLPSTGPVLPLPILSGAQRTLINGSPAARCGDIGASIWCGSFVPLYELFLGSSSVWIEGARAARMTCDITNHCIFTARPRPSDPPIGSFNGTTYTGSPNVIIGGVPMPSLLSLLLGQVFKILFRGAAKGIAAIRAAREAVDAADTAVMHAVSDAADTAVMHAAPDAIDNILWEFPQSIRDLVRLSPTLRRQLEILEAHGWSVSRGQGGGYFCNRNAQFIRMAERGDAGREVVEMAHEVGHAHFNQLPHVPPTGLTRDEYVRANVARDMVDEGAAQFNAAKVRDELAQAGHNAPMPGQHADEYVDVYDRHKAGQLSEPEAINDMGDVMRRETNSIDNRPYEDYYGDPYRDWYDNNVAPPASSPPASAPPSAGDTLQGMPPASAPDAADTIPNMPAASDTAPDMPAFSNDFGDTIPGIPPPGGSS